jgi:HK97 family phage portal protein
MGFLDRVRYATEGRALPVREFRDPTAATAQIKFSSPSQAQVPEWDANQALRFGYLANVIAYRCVQIIADTIAARPFRAGLTPPERPGMPAEHNPSARLSQLLGPLPGAAAPNLPARKLWQWSIVQRIVTGRHGWEIELDGDAVVALWPLTSANLKAYPTSSGTDWFRGFAYGRDDDLRSLSTSQVHYGWDPHPNNFREPVSALMSSRYDLSIALASDRYSFGFLKNNAVPAHIVVIDAFAEEKEYEAFKRQWAGAYTGPDNANRTHFHEADRSDDPTAKLSEAIYVETLGVSAKDARFIEQHRASLERIAISLGVPWSKLDASGRTFDNADAEDEAFWQGTILPVADKLAEEVNASLAPRLGSEVGWFDLSGIRALRNRPPVSATDAAALVMANIADREEVRVWFGLTGPAPERVEPQLALPPAMEEPDDGDEPGTVDRSRGGAPRAVGQGREEEAGRSPTQEDGDAGQEVRATVDQEARRAAIWKATDALLVRHEKIWERRFRALFGEQERSTIARLEGNARSKKILALKPDEVRAFGDQPFDPQYWRDRTEDEARSLFEQLASSSFARLEATFGVSFDLEEEFAQLFIGNRANQLAGQVTDTTYRAITDAMSEGVTEGEGIPDIASRIRAVFADATSNRSVVIARTEVISGFNASALSAASSLPHDVVAGQQWIATRDSRTRPSHATADGQIVPVGQPFMVGGAAGMYPGDPALPAGETIQCRCTVAFLTPEEFNAEAALWAEAAPPVPVGRARVALTLVPTGTFDEPQFRRALEAV